MHSASGRPTQRSRCRLPPLVRTHDPSKKLREQSRIRWWSGPPPWPRRLTSGEPWPRRLTTGHGQGRRGAQDRSASIGHRVRARPARSFRKGISHPKARVKLELEHYFECNTCGFVFYVLIGVGVGVGVGRRTCVPASIASPSERRETPSYLLSERCGSGCALCQARRTWRVVETHAVRNGADALHEGRRHRASTRLCVSINLSPRGARGATRMHGRCL